VLELISRVPSFRISRELGNRKNFDDWRQVLRWWLAKNTLAPQPVPAQVTAWFDFESNNFIYRGAWGLGSVLSLLLDTGDDGLPIAALEIDNWPRSGLPWIAFWLKELLTWGTLEPVAAFLLARGNAVDRPQAERESEAYYEQLPGGLDDNEKLNPRRVREWLNERGAGVQAARAAGPRPIDVTLARNADAYVEQLLNVMHVETRDGLSWIDGAGYLVARSARPGDWPANPSQYQCQLDVVNARVNASLYLPHV
jgi:hypothetical protein